jgi:hypothetical protein
VRDNARGDCDGALDDHPSNGEPFQPEGIADEYSAFGRICGCRHRTYPIFILQPSCADTILTLPAAGALARRGCSLLGGWALAR